MRRSSIFARASSAGDPSVARDAIVAKFTRVVPGWLRRCGVQRSDLADAVQEALVEALVKMREEYPGASLDDPRARHELMRIVSNVALRARRRVQRENDRYLQIEQVEVPSARDEEAWVEARVVVLMALENLDEPTRALIYAHEIEGRTNVEIAAALNLKEDAVEKRVFTAKQRLRAEIERIEPGRHWTRAGSRNGRDLFVLGMGFDFSDPLDRALFGAMNEVCGPKPRFSLFSSSSISSMRQFVGANLPTTMLAGALALAPNASANTTESRALSFSENHVLAHQDANGDLMNEVTEISPSAILSIPTIFLTQGFVSKPANLVPHLAPETNRIQRFEVSIPRFHSPSSTATVPSSRGLLLAEPVCPEDPGGRCDAPVAVPRKK